MREEHETQRKLRAEAEARVRAQIEAQELVTRNSNSSANQNGAPVQLAGVLQNQADTQPEQSTSTPQDSTSAQLEQSVTSPNHSADNQTTQQSDVTPTDDPGEEANDMLVTIQALNDLTNSSAGLRSTTGRTKNRALLRRSLTTSSENSLARNRTKRSKK